MDTLLGFVYLVIGALIGGLLVLAIDSRYLGRRLQDALAAKKKLQEELKRIVRRVAASEATIRELKAKLAGGGAPTRQTSQQRRPAPFAVGGAGPDLLTLRENLKRMANQSDQLVADKQKLSIRLAEADGMRTALQDQLARVGDENRHLQEKNEQLQHQLGAAEVEIKYLRRDPKPAEPEPAIADEEPGQELRAAGIVDSVEDALADDLDFSRRQTGLPEPEPAVADEEPGEELRAAGIVDSVEEALAGDLDFSRWEAGLPEPEQALEDSEAGQALPSAGIGAPTELLAADALDFLDEAPAEGPETVLSTHADVMPAITEPEKTAAEESETVAPEGPAPSRTSSARETGSEIQQIRGIGPVYAGRLQEAGVQTLGDLAAMTPGEVTVILGLKASQLAKPSDWIDQAQNLLTEVSDAESPS